MTKTSFIALTDKIIIREVQENGIYNYYLGDTFIFGVENRFSGEDLRNLYNNGYFDFWLYKAE